MRVMWLIYCPHCQHQGTNALPPEHPDFVPVVSCSTCNKPINARIGKLIVKPTRIRKREPVDLLEVL